MRSRAGLEGFARVVSGDAPAQGTPQVRRPARGPICVALDGRGAVAHVAQEKWLRLLLVACREAVADARDSPAPGRRALVPGLEELCAEFHARVLELEVKSLATTSRPYGR